MKLENFKPLNSLLLIRRTESESVSAGGIIVPSKAKSKMMQGKVIKVAPDVDADIKVNDVVIFNKYSETEVTLDGVVYCLVESDDAIALQR